MHDDLRALIADVVVHDRQSFTLKGTRRTIAPDAELPPSMSSFGDVRAYSHDFVEGSDREIGHLVVALYSLYARIDNNSRAATDLASERDFVARLSTANAGSGSWDSGWNVRGRLDDGRVVVERDGVGFWCSADRVRPAKSRGTAVERYEVLLDNELQHMITGFYSALGNSWDAAEAPLLRIYWNLRSVGASAWVRAVTSELNASEIPFRAKVLNSPTAFGRADSAVIYLHRPDFDLARPRLRSVAEAVADYLNEETPLLTKKLAAGVALAESPPVDSFGLARMKLVACALWSCAERGLSTLDDRTEHVELVFKAAGVDVERPFLEPGSDRMYDLESSDLGRLDKLHARVMPNNASDQLGKISDNDAAAIISRELCSGALWDEQDTKCTWTNDTYISDPVLGKVRSRKVIGPDLYGGTVGIALFLIDAVACGVNVDAASTAVGAVAQSYAVLRGGRGVSAISPISFFAGELGLLYAAVRVSEIAPAPLLDEVVEWCLTRLQSTMERGSLPFDTIDGCAGAIPVLLQLGKVADLGVCLPIAVQCGEFMLENAGMIDGHYTWPTRVRSFGGAPITGLSHGASGLARAMLELYAATGTREFLETARSAFESEDDWWSPAARNWVDTRAEFSGSAGERSGRTHVAWCHGAPGIALARARASQLDAEHAQEHRRKVQGVAQTILAESDRSSTNELSTGLCHGASGLAETVRLLGSLGFDFAQDQRGGAAEQAWRSALTRDLLKARTRAEPSLMAGAAGLGYHLLRVGHADLTSSVLLPVPS